MIRITLWIADRHLKAKIITCSHREIEELVEVILLANLVEEEGQGFVGLLVLNKMVFIEECIELNFIPLINQSSWSVQSSIKKFLTEIDIISQFQKLQIFLFFWNANHSVGLLSFDGYLFLFL